MPSARLTRKYFLQNGAEERRASEGLLLLVRSTRSRARFIRHTMSHATNILATHDSWVCAFNLASARFPEIHIKWNVISMIIFYSKRKWLILVRLVQTFLVYFLFFAFTSILGDSLFAHFTWWCRNRLHLYVRLVRGHGVITRMKNT